MWFIGALRNQMQDLRVFMPHPILVGSFTVMLLALGVPAGAAPFKLFFSDGSGNFGFNNGLNPATIAFIESAQTSVDLAVFNLTDDDPAGNSIVDALISRHAAMGGGVRVIVDDNNAGHPAVDALIDAGIPVKFDTDTFDEMHNKFIVVDDLHVLTSTANFTEPGLSEQDNMSLQIDDPTIAGVYTDEFNEMWGGSWKEFSPLSTAVDFTVDGRPVRVLFGAEDDPIGGVEYGLRSFVQGATTSIHFGAYVWTDQVGDFWPSLSDDVVDKWSSGVAVRGIFDRDLGATTPPYSNGEEAQMDELGMNVRLSQNADRMHLKLMVIDQRVLAVGSANFTYSADAYNDENMVFYDDPRAARRAVQYLQWLHAQTVDEGTAETPSADLMAPPPAVGVAAEPGGLAASVKVTWSPSGATDAYLAHLFVASGPIDSAALHWRTGPMEVAASVAASAGTATVTALSDGTPLSDVSQIYVAVIIVDRAGNESALGAGSVAGPISLEGGCLGPELCNGQDDDCDAQTADGSDDPAVGVSCDGPDADLCAEGLTVCDGGAIVCGDVTGDSAEVPDGLDNDCDGATDEGFADPAPDAGASDIVEADVSPEVLEEVGPDATTDILEIEPALAASVSQGDAEADDAPAGLLDGGGDDSASEIADSSDIATAEVGPSDVASDDAQVDGATEADTTDGGTDAASDSASETSSVDGGTADGGPDAAADSNVADAPQPDGDVVAVDATMTHDALAADTHETLDVTTPSDAKPADTGIARGGDSGSSVNSDAVTDTGAGEASDGCEAAPGPQRGLPGLLVVLFLVFTVRNLRRFAARA